MNEASRLDAIQASYSAYRLYAVSVLFIIFLKAKLVNKMLGY